MAVHFSLPGRLVPISSIPSHPGQISNYQENHSITIPINILLNSLNAGHNGGMSTITFTTPTLPSQQLTDIPKQNFVKVVALQPQTSILPQMNMQPHVTMQPTTFATHPSQTTHHTHFQNIAVPSVQSVTPQKPPPLLPQAAMLTPTDASIAVHYDPVKSPQKDKSIRCFRDLGGDRCHLHEQRKCTFFHDDEGVDVITFSCPSKHDSLKINDCPDGNACRKLPCRDLHPHEVKRLFHNKNIEWGWAIFMWSERRKCHVIVQVLPLKYTDFLKRVPDCLPAASAQKLYIQPLPQLSATASTMLPGPVHTAHPTAQRVATTIPHAQLHLSQLPHTIATTSAPSHHVTQLARLPTPTFSTPSSTNSSPSPVTTPSSAASSISPPPTSTTPLTPVSTLRTTAHSVANVHTHLIHRPPTTKKTATVKKKSSCFSHVPSNVKTFVCLWKFRKESCVNESRSGPGTCGYVHPEEKGNVWRWSKIPHDRLLAYKTEECAKKAMCTLFNCDYRHPKEYRRRIVRDNKEGWELVRWSPWTEKYHVIRVHDASHEPYLRQVPLWENNPDLFPQNVTQSAATIASTMQPQHFSVLQKMTEKVETVIQLQHSTEQKLAIATLHISKNDNTLRCTFEFLNQECSSLAKNRCGNFHDKKGVVMAISEIKDKNRFKKFGCELEMNCYRADCNDLHPGELRRKITSINVNGWELLRWSAPKKSYMIMRMVSLQDEQYIQKIPIWIGTAPTAMTLAGNVG